jgi:hypothetical protein
MAAEQRVRAGVCVIRYLMTTHLLHTRRSCLLGT